MRSRLSQRFSQSNIWDHDFPNLPAEYIRSLYFPSFPSSDPDFNFPFAHVGGVLPRRIHDGGTVFPIMRSRLQVSICWLTKCITEAKDPFRHRLWTDYSWLNCYTLCNAQTPITHSKVHTCLARATNTQLQIVTEYSWLDQDRALAKAAQLLAHRFGSRAARSSFMEFDHFQGKERVRSNLSTDDVLK